MELTDKNPNGTSQDILLCTQQFIECVGTYFGTYLLLEEQKKSQVLELQNHLLQGLNIQNNDPLAPPRPGT